MDCGRIMRSILPIPMIKQSTTLPSQSPSSTTPSITWSLWSSLYHTLPRNHCDRRWLLWKCSRVWAGWIECVGECDDWNLEFHLCEDRWRLWHKERSKRRLLPDWKLPQTPIHSARISILFRLSLLWIVQSPFSPIPGDWRRLFFQCHLVLSEW